MDEPVRVRRPVASEEPATDPSIKRMYWWGGAIAGIVIGVVVALFAIPPVFDRFFGVADIALGSRYNGDAVELRVASTGATSDGDRLAVVFEVLRNDGWCPAEAGFRLELEGRVSLGSARVEPGGCDAAATAAKEVTVSFPAGAHDASGMHILHVDEPKVRFWLQPGEPGE